MRVLWFGQRDIEHPLGGGGARTAFEIHRRLVARGHEVRMVSSGWPGAPSHADIDGVQIRRFPSYLLPHAVHPLMVRLGSRPNVVVDDLAHPIPWATPVFSRLRGTAYFHHLHRRTLRGQVGGVTASLLTAFERSYGRVYSEWPFVASTPSSVRDLSQLGIPATRCRVIPPGVNSELFRPGPRSDTPRLVYFGGMRSYKRPAHAILALYLLRKSGVEAELMVVGQGPALESMRTLCASLSLESRVRFLGRLAGADLAQVVGSAWVNLHCSVAEGWGLSIVEAAACGVPTVAYRVPVLTESIVEGRTGRLVADGDPAAMARAIAEMLPEAQSWSRPCREYAEGLSWDRTVDAWEQHLREIAS